MKASKFSDAQKAFILKQGSDGVPVRTSAERLDQPSNLFNWKKKLDGLLPTEMPRLKQLEDENSKLKKLVANLLFDRDASGRHPPKAVRPVRKRKLVDAVCGEWDVSSGVPAGFLRSTHPPITINRDAPDRPASKNASRRSARPACATAIDVFTSCCSARAGASIRRRRGASIAS